MSICGKCIHYEICDEYVSPCETFPETENGCPCYKSKDDFSEVKHGEWKSGKTPNGLFGYYCSICTASFVGENAEWIAKEHRYCHKCGAKMDGERKSENE